MKAAIMSGQAVYATVKPKYTLFTHSHDLMWCYYNSADLEEYRDAHGVFCAL